MGLFCCQGRIPWHRASSSYILFWTTANISPLCTGTPLGGQDLWNDLLASALLAGLSSLTHNLSHALGQIRLLNVPDGLL